MSQFGYQSLGFGGGSSSVLTDELAYPTGIWMSSNYVISVSPIFHFDAAIIDGVNKNADSASPPVSGVTTVDEWKDRSGNTAVDYDATQTYAPWQPTYHLSSGVEFLRGGNMPMNNTKTTATSGAFTYVAVADRPDTGTKFTPLGDSGSGAYTMLGYSNDYTLYVHSGSINTSISPSVAQFDAAVADAQMVMSQRSAISSDVPYRFLGNNVWGDKVTSVTFNVNHIGRSHNNYNTTGAQYEILFFDSFLGAADLNVIRNYFWTKYAISYDGVNLNDAANAFS